MILLTVENTNSYAWPGDFSENEFIFESSDFPCLMVLLGNHLGGVGSSGAYLSEFKGFIVVGFIFI